MPLLFLSWFVSLVHPFYVSVTDIQHNQQEKTLEISIRIFTDDFENTLRMHHPQAKIDLINPPPGGAMDSLIKQYVLAKMGLKVNGRAVKMAYVGFERVEESIWTYFEVTGVTQVQSIGINNPLLYEYKKEQINMVHVETGGKRQSRKLDNPVAEWEFRF